MKLTTHASIPYPDPADMVSPLHVQQAAERNDAILTAYDAAFPGILRRPTKIVKASSSITGLPQLTTNFLSFDTTVYSNSSLISANGGGSFVNAALVPCWVHAYLRLEVQPSGTVNAGTWRQATLALYNANFAFGSSILVDFWFCQNYENNVGPEYMTISTIARFDTADYNIATLFSHSNSSSTINVLTAFFGISYLRPAS